MRSRSLNCCRNASWREVKLYSRPNKEATSLGGLLPIVTCTMLLVTVVLHVALATAIIITLRLLGASFDGSPNPAAMGHRLHELETVDIRLVSEPAPVGGGGRCGAGQRAEANEGSKSDNSDARAFHLSGPETFRLHRAARDRNNEPDASSVSVTTLTHDEEAWHMVVCFFFASCFRKSCAVFPGSAPNFVSSAEPSETRIGALRRVLLTVS